MPQDAKSPISVVLCSYSHGLGNGIAAIDETLIAGLDPARFAVKAFVLRADLPPGRFEVLDWCRVFLDTKIGESRLKRSP